MENQRVRLSKKLLKDALIELLQDKDISKIKVQEICKHAEVNRTTFYKYYGCPQDVLDEIEKEMFEKLSQHMKLEQGPWGEVLTQTINYMISDIKRWRTLINATTDLDFVEKLFACSTLQSELDNTMNLPGKYTAAQMKYIHVFIYSGCYAMLRKWINQEKSRESAEEMAELLTSFASDINRISD